MLNNRMLAVAAVLTMAVPALGAATPIVVPPVPEQLVEGHTVFTVIEIMRATATNETRFAAAVAVLVREIAVQQRNQRFPGVLWFNDQYLVNPVQNANAFVAFRYPCGGAVMAVNAGDPDPRVVIARVQATTPAVDNPAPVPDIPSVGAGPLTVGDSEQTYTYPPWIKPYPGTYSYGNDYAWVGADVDGGTVTTDPAAGGPSATGQDALVYSDTTIGATLGGVDAALLNATPPWDYRESYLITDPNDHSWIIDKYEFYTRDQVSLSGGLDSQNLDNTLVKLFDDVPPDSTGFQPDEHYPSGADPNGLLRTSYTYPVWVVNTLGSPVFVPDYGTTVTRSGQSYIGENCAPFKDLIETNTAALNGALCGVAIQDGEFIDSGNDTDITLNAYNGVPPWTDDPCMSYESPSRNGFCYGGQSPDPVAGCDAWKLRQYNALLYFKLEDLRVFGAPRDHCNFDPSLNGGAGGCNPALSNDTNGCSEEQYPWGPNPPQAAYDWPCPEDSTAPVGECDGTAYPGPPGGNDDCEGNSHPFHPTVPPHEEREPCLPAFAGPNPTNHGGSTYIQPGTRAYYDPISGQSWFQVSAPCDYLHATRNIDIYFSPAGRPFPPVLRYFDVVDLEGSSAPFHDFHSAYPGVN